MGNEYGIRLFNDQLSKYVRARARVCVCVCVCVFISVIGRMVRHVIPFKWPKFPLVNGKMF